MNTPQQHRFHLEAATKKEKSLLDKLVYVVGVVFPLMTIPQIIEIWAGQSADGVSLITWVGYWFLSFLYTLWSIADRVKPIIISQLLWQIVYIVMFISIIHFS